MVSKDSKYAQVIEVTGVVGGRVEFVCDVSVESTDHPDLSWKPTEQSALLHRKNIAQSGYSNFRTHHDPLDNGYLVLWFYENERKPIYSYDARATSNFGHHWSDPTKLGKRAWFISAEQTGISAAKLQITDLVEEDAGVYRCRVDYKTAPSKYYKFMLSIIVLMLMNAAEMQLLNAAKVEVALLD
ncbi:hypothetical protein QYM36_015694 [Artemia franciscana]|uniref:Ig-like domain-containing protein n=1 Tax=Artemia franciscana TaxID=6661 RepID=A0AA88HJ90_ARTSF|nr:hypothetical protein QYM36_015694 [Artemia franciscana]